MVDPGHPGSMNIDPSDDGSLKPYPLHLCLCVRTYIYFCLAGHILKEKSAEGLGNPRQKKYSMWPKRSMKNGKNRKIPLRKGFIQL